MPQQTQNTYETGCFNHRIIQKQSPPGCMAPRRETKVLQFGHFSLGAKACVSMGTW